MIYLDNAATTFPKPPSVYRAVDRCLRDWCGNPGRSGHALSIAAATAIYDCRCEAAALLGVSSPEQIIFTHNTTHALNMAIKGLLRRGDHVLISDLEHNAVLRPISALAAYGDITFDTYPSFACSPEREDDKIIDALSQLCRPETRMVIAAHASNLAPITLPLAAIGRFCHAHDMFFVVDAAQSAGIEEIDFSGMGIDALCLPGHKGLYGPQGTGILVLREGLTMATLLEGGNGINSLDPMMPEFSPERYEAGTPATPALAGLCAGIRFVRERTPQAIRDSEQRLCRRLAEMLGNLPGITIYAPHAIGSSLLFNLDEIPSERVAERLDREGICLRAGFHCAPLGHRTLGTGENGALRVGFSVFNRPAELEQLVSVLRRIRQTYATSQ